MDAEEFKVYAKQMAELIANYRNSSRHRQPVPSVQPGFLRNNLPREPPQEPERFDSVLQDIQPLILSGVTDWHHPQFHAYYPTACSYPALLADMLSDAIACIGFSWIASPSCTELETVMMDWICKALSLPDHFLFNDEGEGKGGGVIQGSASEATLMVFFAARSRAIAELQVQQPELDQWQILGKLVAYSSDQAHCSVERASKLACMRLRQLPTDGKRALRGDELQRAVSEDLANGLVPVLCVATLGTTSTCAFDNVQELGNVCQSQKMWLHVDAAYAGTALLCPELRHLGQGLQLADSFNFNAHKWMQVTFDCSLLWVKDSTKLVDIFSADPVYLQHEFHGLPDYRHWQIPLGRRFRALKIWFVVRTFGISGLQELVRKHVKLAKLFESQLMQDSRFEIVEEVVLGIVCFRLKIGNAATELLYKRIRDDNRIHLVASKFDNPDTFFIRFVLCSYEAEEQDVRFAIDVITELTNQMSDN